MGVRVTGECVCNREGTHWETPVNFPSDLKFLPGWGRLDMGEHNKKRPSGLSSLRTLNAFWGTRTSSPSPLGWKKNGHGSDRGNQPFSFSPIGRELSKEEPLIGFPPPFL